MTPERAVELVSPTSELGVDLFKADLVITDFQELALPGILCLVTDIAGAIKSSNIRLDVINVFELLPSPCIRKQIEDIQQEYNQYSHTLLNGLIERITLNDIDMFVLIKLQLWYQEGEKLLIWTLTKASIVSAAEEDRIVFTFADEKKFTFEKLKISFGIDDELFLVNFPNNLTKYLIPSHVHPECLSDLIDCDLNLIKASLKMEITSRICYFMDSFDNLPHSSHFHENTILFAGSVALKPTSVPFQLKIFQSVRSRDGKTVFPANLTLEGRQFESLCNLSNNTDLAISSSKHELIRLISRSDHSIVYLSKGSGDELVVIKKSLQANNAERTFFEFLEACPEKCPFIESPQATEFDENIMVFKYHPDCVDLFHFIELNLQLTDSCVRQIFIQICLAVKFLHSHNVVHRDIKVSLAFMRSPSLFRTKIF